MSDNESISAFLAYCAQHIKGDEKGEAHIFLDRLFTALGHKEGLKGAGADLEYRVHDGKKRSTSFADLVWPKRALIEMKKRGEDLSLHLQQATNYWFKLAGKRPRYVILCNFTEFWVYDFDTDPDEPQDVVKLEDLAKHRQSFAFLLPREQKPLFRTNRVDVTEKAAEKVAEVFRSLVKRGTPRDTAMHYCLQCILAMFAEDVELLPDKIFTQLIAECEKEPGAGPDACEKSYDLIAGLFRAMNEEGITEAGAYRGVDYFNGGLFQRTTPVLLTMHEVNMLDAACLHDWSSVNPAIFGSFFEGGMEVKERHKRGAHYTYEIDIKKIVDPVIVQPFQERIAEALDAADPLEGLYSVLRELRTHRVLDPACGSGNFLFVAYREMKKLEKQLIAQLREHSTSREQAKRFARFMEQEPHVSTRQFFGLDIKRDAVEVAKVTLMTAKELWCTQHGKDFETEKALPLDNLDVNILCVDALLNDDGTQRAWPEADSIIGNPPYQSKNKMQAEFGAAYVAKLHNAYPEVPGRADFCVYWFRRAHDHLRAGGRAGLVGTNTIRQNYSREGSLDYIVANGGAIYSAVSSQIWHGRAVVHVSLVSWVKGEGPEECHLFTQEKDGTLHLHKLNHINSSLSTGADVTSARALLCNKRPKRVFQGQTHGHEAFLLSISDGRKHLLKEPGDNAVLKPFLIGDELLSEPDGQPTRFVIDFSALDITAAAAHRALFNRVEKEVMPDRKARAEKQQEDNDALLKEDDEANVNKHHINFYNHWWQLSWGRADMLKRIGELKRYAACSRVTSRPIFEFVEPAIHPNDALMVFGFEDDYSFGVIASQVHIAWYQAKCSTMKADPRYTTESVWDTFPWPQNPSEKHVVAVAAAARMLREARTKAMREHKQSLRDLYRLMEKPGKNALKDLHAALDLAVMNAYGFSQREDLLTQLLRLNLEVSRKEDAGQPVQKPGLPEKITDPERFVSDDCVRFKA